MKHVYVFDVGGKSVKIGISKDVKRRILEIQNGSGNGILRHYETEPMSERKAYRVEQALHAHFANYRTFGEFFKITFEEACAELDRLNPPSEVTTIKHTPTFEENVDDLIGLFVETFCTTDKNEGGVCGVGIDKDYFINEFNGWVLTYYDCVRECDELKFNEYGTTGRTIFVTEPDFFAKVAKVNGQQFDSNSSLLTGLYWKRGTPMQMDLYGRVRQARGAFTGLKQHDKDSIIGGFVNDILNGLNPATMTVTNIYYDLFQPVGMDFATFVWGINTDLSRRISELCGVPFEVEPICRDNYWGLFIHCEPGKLDVEKIGVYYGSFTQIIQRYCPLEVFFYNQELRVRYVGKEKEERRGEES